MIKQKKKKNTYKASLFKGGRQRVGQGGDAAAWPYKHVVGRPPEAGVCLAF